MNCPHCHKELPKPKCPVCHDTGVKAELFAWYSAGGVERAPHPRFKTFPCDAYDSCKQARKERTP